MVPASVGAVTATEENNSEGGLEKILPGFPLLDSWRFFLLISVLIFCLADCTAMGNTGLC
jgi:hypothetical protein